MKVIENFETFSESINTPSYDQRFGSYVHCKLGCVENQFWTDQTVWTCLDFKATFKGNLEELLIQRS
jgi:hypothetical protein